MDQGKPAPEHEGALLSQLEEILGRAESASGAENGAVRETLASARRCLGELRAAVLRREAAARSVVVERYGRSPVPLLSIDLDGFIREANDAAAELFCAPSADVLVGRHFLSVAHAKGDGAHRFGEHLRRLEERAGRVTTELVVRNARNQSTIVRLVSRPPRLRETDAPTVVLDVTDRKRLDATKTVLELCAARFGRMATPAAVIGECPRIAVPLLADVCIAALVDRCGAPTCAATKHFDARTAQVLRETTPEALFALPGIRAAVRSALRNSTATLVERFVPSVEIGNHELARALEIRSLLVIPMLGRGDPVGLLVLGTCNDHEPYGAEDVALAEELARRASLAIDNGLLFRELHEANEAKDRFLTVLSHELRTPLTPVLVSVSACLEHGVKRSPELAPMLEMIKRNVELEARLIDDLLDATRMARGHLELNLSTLDLHGIVEIVVDVCRQDLTSRKLNLTVDLHAPHHHVRADPARLEQALGNLLKNAVKFTPPGGDLAISTRNVDGDLVFALRDSGIGLDAAQMARIFEPFAQADPTVARRFGGTGLGLSIARTIARALGGNLSAASEGAGRGATFTLELPWVDAPAEAMADEAPRPETSSAGPPGVDSTTNLEILLVNDDDDTLAVTSALLASANGCSVTCAQSVAAALEKAQSKRFDLVISDIGLPDGSGLDLMRELRARHAELKGIALSGYGSREDVASAERAGFRAHLTKPVSFRDLESKIWELTR
jgi:signal transduction histidine kinase/CheY-like chemotaxis protein